MHERVAKSKSRSAAAPLRRHVAAARERREVDRQRRGYFAMLILISFAERGGHKTD